METFASIMTGLGLALLLIVGVGFIFSGLDNRTAVHAVAGAVLIHAFVVAARGASR